MERKRFDYEKALIEVSREEVQYLKKRVESSSELGIGLEILARAMRESHASAVSDERVDEITANVTREVDHERTEGPI